MIYFFWKNKSLASKENNTHYFPKCIVWIILIRTIMILLMAPSWVHFIIGTFFSELIFLTDYRYEDF